MKRWNLDGEIMKLRGLGFEQSEIADILGVSQPTVHNYLKDLKVRCLKESVDTVFFEMCSKLYLPKLLRLLK